MTTTTITLTQQALERLQRARRSPDDSLSDVVLRGQWPEPLKSITAGELLEHLRERGPLLTEEQLDRIEQAIEDQRRLPGG